MWYPINGEKVPSLEKPALFLIARLLGFIMGIYTLRMTLITRSK